MRRGGREEDKNGSYKRKFLIELCFGEKKEEIKEETAIGVAKVEQYDTFTQNKTCACVNV